MAGPESAVTRMPPTGSVSPEPVLDGEAVIDDNENRIIWPWNKHLFKNKSSVHPRIKRFLKGGIGHES